VDCNEKRIITCAVLIYLCVCHASLLHAADTADASSAVVEQAEQRFDMYELRVLGNTTLQQRDIERMLYPFLGTQRTLADVEAARKALETLYHDRGYGTVYVDIPEQTVDSGVVRLAVTEAKLRVVAVTGAKYFSNQEIKAAIPAAQVGTTPSLPKLQAQIAELNVQSSDRQVVPVLKAGAVPGTVDLNLKVDDQLPLHGSLEVNNQYTAHTTPLRANAALSYDNLFAHRDSLAVQYQNSPQDTEEVKVWMGSYTTHVFDDATRLILLYVDSDSDVALLGTGDTAVNVLGKGKGASARLIHPLAGGNNSLGSVNIGVDYKDFLQNICNDIDLRLCETTGFITPIEYFNFSLGYSGGWGGETLQGTFSLFSNFGVRGLRNDPIEFQNKRFMSTANYIDFRSDGMLMLRLPANSNLQLRYSGQYAFDPLISNEQFAIAGVDGVRSYFESEELGDRGIKTTIQLGSPPLKLFGSSLQTDAYAFYDYGAAQLLRTLPSEKDGISIAAVGAGLNIGLLRHINGNLFWAHALRDGTDTRRGDSRYQFYLRVSW
jgi:hemolysin activation/secretion protein